LSFRKVVRSDRIKSDDFVKDVIELLRLRDYTAEYQVVYPLCAGGNDGEIFKLFLDNEAHVVKIYSTGLSSQYVKFQKALEDRKDDPATKRHPGCEAVYFAAVPVGWVTHMDKIGLVFRYVVPPRKARRLTASDRKQVQDQMDFVHSLGFCHLDITSRNILVAHEDKCYLMDFDCVCLIKRCPLGPLPPESSEAVLRRDPVEIEDDLHLWEQLQQSCFNHLLQTVQDTPTVPIERVSEVKVAIQQTPAASVSVAAPAMSAVVVPLRFQPPAVTAAAVIPSNTAPAASAVVKSTLSPATTAALTVKAPSSMEDARTAVAAVVVPVTKTSDASAAIKATSSSLAVAVASGQPAPSPQEKLQAPSACT